MPYLKPCHATGFNNNGTKVYTVTYRRASPASAHRHDSRAALSEVKDIDDISTETIIMIITRHRSRQPAHVRAAASPPHARLMPAYLLLLLLRSIYHPHIQRRLTPSALSTYHARGLQAEQESLPEHKRSVAGSVEAKGSITGTWCGGKPRKPKKIKLCALSCFSRERVSSSDGAPFCFGLQNAWRDMSSKCAFLKFREQSVSFQVRACKGTGGSVCALERGELSDALRGGGCRRAMTFLSILLGFFGVDKATVRVLFRRARTRMVIAFRA